MKKIKVNDYVRTKKGYIGRVIRFDEDNNLFCDNIISDMCGEKFRWLNKLEQKEQITKHSPNIIDLIEVGDYVNGYKVIDVKEFTFTTIEQGLKVHHKQCVTIKSMVTHESFNSIKYEVE